MNRIESIVRRIIREEIEKIEEAVPVSQVRPLMKLNRVNKHRDDFFKKLVKLPNAIFSKRKDRVYFPIEKITRIGRLEKEISDVLSKYDYKLINYLKNVAETPKGQRIKMTKALARVGENDLLNFYSSQSKAKTKDVASGRLICFSKHPYDLKGMSLGRKWEGGSCMARSIGKEYIPVDIEEGTIVVYSIEADDLNLSNPIGRLLLKQFINNINPNEVIYFTEKRGYGLISPIIRIFIERIMVKVQGVGSGDYTMNCRLYSDGSVQRSVADSSGKDELDSVGMLRTLGIDTFKERGKIIAKGDVKLSRQGLTEIPFNIDEVRGYMDVEGNMITHLKWFPKKIDYGLNLIGNRIKSWKFGPEEVGSLHVSENPINTLVGSPTIIDANDGFPTLTISKTNISNFKGFKFIGKGLTIKAEDMPLPLSFEGLDRSPYYEQIIQSGVPMKDLTGVPRSISMFEVITESAMGLSDLKIVDFATITLLPKSLGDIDILVDALSSMKYMEMIIRIDEKYHSILMTSLAKEGLQSRTFVYPLKGRPR